MYPDANGLRPRLALEAIQAYVASGYEVVVVDSTKSDPRFRPQLVRPGVTILLEDEAASMGAARRKAMRRAGELAGPNGIVLWAEPEKPLAHLVDTMVQPFLHGCDLVIPSRESLDSYPPEQAYAEKLGNQFVQYLLGKELDFWFGPMLMNQSALDFVLDYDGYWGDVWDSLMVPRLRAFAAGLAIGTVEVDYVHPQAQTAEESGDIEFLMKRIEQLRTIVPALHSEAVKLGIVAQPR
jgi:hypothetical protein